MPIRHVVAAGECISSLGFQYGFFPETLWELAENATLRAARQDGNVLEPGDAVHIPDLRQRTERCVMDRQHVFRRRGVPARLRIQLRRKGEPRANTAYRLEVEGKVVGEGRTDGEGRLSAHIPPDGKTGRLIVDGDEIYELALGSLPPVGGAYGARARLINLGYLRKDEDGAAAMAGAVRAFQCDRKLDVTGKLDEATVAKLLETHGR